MEWRCSYNGDLFVVLRKRSVGNVLFGVERVSHSEMRSLAEKCQNREYVPT